MYSRLLLALTATLLLTPALAGGQETSATTQPAAALPAGAQQGMLDIDGARIHYVSVGQGTPMLLLHGYPLSGELFARNRAALVAAGYRVITIDHRGFGRSTAPASNPGGINVYASDALRVMDRLGIQKAVIGGMSMGGPIAFEMYRRAPDRFLGMVLIATLANPANLVEQNLWRGMAQEATAFGPKALVDDLIKDMLTGQTRANRAADVAFLSDIVRNASLAGDVAGATALATRPDSLPTLPLIRVPTLIVVGVEDTVYPPVFSLKMQQNIPGSRLVQIPGAAHAVNFEKAAETNRAIIDWARANNLR